MARPPTAVSDPHFCHPSGARMPHHRGMSWPIVRVSQVSWLDRISGLVELHERPDTCTIDGRQATQPVHGVASFGSRGAAVVCGRRMSWTQCATFHDARALPDAVSMGLGRRASNRKSKMGGDLGGVTRGHEVVGARRSCDTTGRVLGGMSLRRDEWHFTAGQSQAHPDLRRS
jgi:hypothetical protein